MMDRCFNPFCSTYNYYGGKGIKVCDEWHVFSTFLRDMGERPSPDHTIDRKDNSKDYEPGNCQWSVWSVQTRNKSNNVWVEAFGKKLIVADWAKETGLHKTTILRRLAKGWSPEEAISLPTCKQKK